MNQQFKCFEVGQPDPLSEPEEELEEVLSDSWSVA
jgi:hypothetical protein